MGAPDDRTPVEDKDEDGKCPLHLLPPGAIFELGYVFGHGAAKYGAWSWARVPARRYASAALRHIFAYLDGEIEDESGYHHLAHAAASLVMAVDIERNSNGRTSLQSGGV